MKNNIFCCFLLIFSLFLTSCNENIPASGETSSTYYVSRAPSETEVSSTPEDTVTDTSFTLAVTGDICFADNSEIMENARQEGLAPIDCISPELSDRMKDANFCLTNNEFCYSDRGEPMEDKAYTFRAATQNAEYLNDLGIDLAGLANNHVFDYGEEAFLDTLDTLDNIGIPYIGAGRNKNEAYAPYYTDINGTKLAFVAASRAEKYYMTPVTDGDYPGIAGTYDWETQSFIEEIKEADKNADFVIVYVHWGTEYSTELQESQKELAREYVDAGADVIIGAHAHILQGFEFYNGVPIIYNLGNFWFNLRNIDTVLLELEFDGTDVKVHLVPAVQKEGKTTLLEGSDAIDLFKYLEDISINVTITDDGYVIPNSH